MQLDLEIQNWCGGTSLEAIWQKTAKNGGIFAVADSVVLEKDSSFQSQSLPTNRELTMKFAEICNHKICLTGKPASDANCIACPSSLLVLAPPASADHGQGS